MKTQFDKIYIVSLIINHDRQKFIKQQLDELNINFEFIYGTDFQNFEADATGKQFEFPYTFDIPVCNTSTNFGCALTHYNAVLQAYEFGYNNILIIEDDICFIKNKQMIFDLLNNIPFDADFVTWDPRFLQKNDNNELINFINEIKLCNNNYINLKNNYVYLCGSMMYGLMNKYSMEIYLNNQRKNFNMPDRVIGLWKNPVLKRYVCTKCLCADQYNIQNNFNVKEQFYINLYSKINKLYLNDFYIPNQYHLFSRI